MIEPSIKGNFNDPRFLAIALAKKGYYGGNVEEILNLPLDVFFDILNYEKYCQDYENELHKLNITK